MIKESRRVGRMLVKVPFSYLWSPGAELRVDSIACVCERESTGRGAVAAFELSSSLEFCPGA